MAPFGQTAFRATARDDTAIERAFRRDYTISVATQFKAQSQPFSVIAPIVLVGPTCVADTATTPQTQPVTTDLLANDVAGSTGGEVEPLLLNTLQFIGNPPAHGTGSLVGRPRTRPRASTTAATRTRTRCATPTRCAATPP